MQPLLSLNNLMIGVSTRFQRKEGSKQFLLKNKLNVLYKCTNRFTEAILPKHSDVLKKLVSSNVSFAQCGVNGLQHIKPPVWSNEDPWVLMSLMAVDMCFLSWIDLLGTVCCLRLQWNSTTRLGLTYNGSVSYCFRDGFSLLNSPVYRIHLAQNIAACLRHLNFNCEVTSITVFVYCTDLNSR